MIQKISSFLKYFLVFKTTFELKSISFITFSNFADTIFEYHQRVCLIQTTWVFIFHKQIDGSKHNQNKHVNEPRHDHVISPITNIFKLCHSFCTEPKKLVDTDRILNKIY